MIAKSALRTTLDEVMEEYEIEDRAFAEGLFDRLVQDFGEEIYDDEDEEEEDDEPELLGD
jgi:hypothetical protein